MMIIKARVTRDGQLREIPAEQLVPGDIVALEAGDVVPADGRLLRAATMEVAESALTGESLPVSKGTEPVEGTGTPLGDRTDMVYMNTNVTRGAGEFVVTATGMATEVTFSLYALFFSITTKDERRTVFSLDTFSDSKFVIATGVSVLTLLLTTVFGPLQAFLNTTSLDVRQWSVCLAVALSIVVVSEIRTAVRRHTAPGHQLTR
jgi:P-type E1-E2 ATPase